MDASWRKSERAKLLGPESDSEPHSPNVDQLERKERARKPNKVREDGNAKRRKAAGGDAPPQKPASKPRNKTPGSSAAASRIGGGGSGGSRRELTEMERRHHWPEVPDSMFVSEDEIKEKMRPDFSGCAFARGCDSFVCHKAFKDLLELHGGKSNAKVKLCDGNTHVLHSSCYGKTPSTSKLVKWKLPFAIVPWYFPKASSGATPTKPYCMSDLSKVEYLPDMGMSLLLEAMAVAEIRLERMVEAGLPLDVQEKAWIVLANLLCPRKGSEWLVGHPELGTLPDQLL